jgi:hypothetical protein
MKWESCSTRSVIHKSVILDVSPDVTANGLLVTELTHSNRVDRVILNNYYWTLDG